MQCRLAGFKYGLYLELSIDCMQLVSFAVFHQYIKFWIYVFISEAPDLWIRHLHCYI